MLGDLASEQPTDAQKGLGRETKERGIATHQPEKVNKNLIEFS